MIALERHSRASRRMVVPIAACLVVGSMTIGCASGVQSSASAGPAASTPAVTPTAAATPPPTSTPASTPAPTWSPFAVPDGRRAQIAQVARAGAIYIVTFTAPADAPATPDVVADVRVERLDQAGRPDAEWTNFTLPTGSAVLDTALADSGTLYVAYGNPADADQSVTVTALDSSGQTLAGWPFTEKAGAYTELSLAPRGALLFMTGSTDSSGAATWILHRLQADGREASGWPVPFTERSGGPVIDSHGDAIVVTGGRVVALGADGKPAPGWTTFQLDSMRLGAPVAGPAGLVLVYSRRDLGSSARLIALALDGKQSTAWKSFEFPSAEAYLRGMEVASEGTTYLSLDTQPEGQGGPAALVALGADGLQKVGYPKELGDFLWAPVTAPGGSVFAPTGLTDGSISLLGFAADGSPLPEFPKSYPKDPWFQLFVGPNGTIYVVSATSGRTSIDQHQTPG